MPNFPKWKVTMTFDTYDQASQFREYICQLFELAAKHGEVDIGNTGRKLRENLRIIEDREL